MGVWAIQGFGAAFNSQELLTVKIGIIKERDLFTEIIMDGEFV